MLKALELNGFKSFADRTRFEFPHGISVVVGPNGSGKSNLVDAVKWVLGSQSAKSLRGKEMTDVIFNGCTTRGPLGTGEVTLTLNNDDGRLPLDAKEVHVTRRVYRSGEGEYLINREPCRLRDIRDLLAGTGITTEAYCIIEQGKVDALLQSSPRDRRVIFEEAAGIAQFKAKKASAMRRLERVEQNLLRLSDIVDEVESRLRSLRSQAGKARRYRDAADRLRQLRTELGLVDWHALTQQIAARESQLNEVRRRAAEQTGLLEQRESDIAGLEQRLEEGNLRLREIEPSSAATREQIAARQATLENRQARQSELQQEAARLRRQLNTMATHAGGVDDRYRDAATELGAAEQELAAAVSDRDSATRAAEELRREFDVARSHVEKLSTELAEAGRATAVCRDQHAAFQVQLESVQAIQAQNTKQQVELAQERELCAADAERRSQAEAALRGQVESHHNAIRSAEKQLAYVRTELARVDKQHRQLDSQITRCRERIAVLTELEERLEGLDGGIQEVLRMAHESPNGPLGEVRGVVADLFRVDVDTAPLIEAALGERAQFVVVASAARLFEWLQRQPFGVTGRIGFLRLDTRVAVSVLDHVDLSAESGVMGRADRFIETAPEYVSLVRRLLGRTWLVDRLATALRLSQSSGRGLEFVTSDGELLAADGTLVIGPRLAAAGIMSRRSELRACHEQATELEQQVSHFAQTHARLEQQRSEQESLLATSVSAYTRLAAELADCRHRSAESRTKLDNVVHRQRQVESDLTNSERRLNELQLEIDAAMRQGEQHQATAERLQGEVQAGRERLTSLDAKLTQSQQAVSERQVIAAKFEQRVEMLRQQAELAQRNRQERERALADTRRRLAEQHDQLVELDGFLLAGRQALAELFLTKEQQGRDLAERLSADETIRGERTELAEQVRHLRQQLTAISAQQHKLEAVGGRFRHERQTLCERMQDDYGIDLAELAGGARGTDGEELEARSDEATPAHLSSSAQVHAPLDRNAAEREISQLRDQINNIGAVNLEALDELESWESRFGTLSAQYRDLVEAKGALERIIQRINVDSRQLFLMTLETVREHFKGLFRRLFGGGEADIVVDEAEDVLESGIEIVARPPGKEACSISLLSGGEKTLACVALLLAVFRSKPSPFCVLDEVDAALDEANIGRFVGVLREFMSFTQFIVVTHSKRTMSGADTLYGVTMEESGVSKRVSVRFEDVGEDGHIRPAIRRTEDASTEDREQLRRAA